MSLPTIQPIDFQNPVLDLGAFAGAGPEQRAALDTIRRQARAGLDLSAFEDPARAWYRTAFLESFLFLYDTSAYDHAAGRWRMDEWLDDGEREFGGYDLVLLWQSYPRLGLDQRNQLDLYRDLPGGLPALKIAVDTCHRRGVRAFVNYNPWDWGTRRETLSDGEALAEIIAAIGADGVFLDTMRMADPAFTAPLYRVRPDLVLDPEHLPAPEHLGSITGGQVDTMPRPPHTSTLRWLEARCSLRGLLRGGADQAEQVAASFFLGCGQVVWENVFGWWSPWSEEDRRMLRHAVRIQRQYSGAFVDRDWQPFVATLQPEVWANRWQDGQTTVYTLFNTGTKPANGPLIRVPLSKDQRLYDVWNDLVLDPPTAGGEALVSTQLLGRRAGCLVVLPADAPSPLVRTNGSGSLLPTERPGFFQQNETRFRSRVTVEAHRPRPVAPSPTALSTDRPADMCFIPAGRFSMFVRHNTPHCMEGACYGGQSDHRDKHHPAQHFWMEPYFIDRTEVTNQQYQEFLRATKWCPKDFTSFLRNWTRQPGEERQPWCWQFPEGKANHPVVFVDLGDARAYARWVGKRLPREEEWQYAAQGTDHRTWPWGECADGHERLKHNMRGWWGMFYGYGNRSDPSRCNDGTSDTTPVDFFPTGASPFGVLDMAGNVWELTESERDDGHTRYVILRGGSHLLVSGSIWYPASGAQPCDVHEKMPLLSPSLDRSATIGFRCVKDCVPWTLD